MSGQEVAIGSRGSALALAQARPVHDALERAGQTGRIAITCAPADLATWLRDER